MSHIENEEIVVIDAIDLDVQEVEERVANGGRAGAGGSGWAY